MGNGSTRSTGRLTGNGIKLGDLFGSIFPAFPVVGIVGENDIDDEVFQGFFVSIGYGFGFDGTECFLLDVPSMPPKPNGFDIETDLGSDVDV